MDAVHVWPAAKLESKKTKKKDAIELTIWIYPLLSPELLFPPPLGGLDNDLGLDCALCYDITFILSN